MLLSRSLKISKDNVSDALVMLLMFSLPFSRKFSSLAILLLALFSIYIFIFFKQQRKEFRIVWFLPVLFIFYLFSSLLSGALSNIEKILLLAIVPVTLGIQGRFFEKAIRNKLFIAYILGNVTVSLICLIRATVNSVHFVDGKWSFTPQIIPGTSYDFLTSSVMGGNHFFGEDFSMFLHPGYFGLYIVFAQYLLFILVRSSDYRIHRYILAGIYFFFLIILFFLSGKAAQISSLILSIGICIHIFFWSKWNWQIKSILIVTMIGIALLFTYFNPRLKTFKDTFTMSQFTEINPNARFGHDLRILSWDASIDVIKQHWLFGVGEGKKEESLVKIYEQKKYVFAAEERFNSHNQYLDFLLSGGIIGLGIFFGGMISLLISARRNSNFPLIIFTILFAFSCLFENLLSRYWGILFFSVFVTLFYNKNKPEKITYTPPPDSQ